MNEYLKQAEDFLAAHNATIEIVFDHCGKYFEDDKEDRNIYQFTITRGEKSYSGSFGDSVYHTQEIKKIRRRAKYENRRLSGSEYKKIREQFTPNAYDVLACMQKYESPTDTWKFAKEFGYEINSRADFRKVDKICEACEKEYKAMCNIFHDCMEELQEIY